MGTGSQTAFDAFVAAMDDEIECDHERLGGALSVALAEAQRDRPELYGDEAGLAAYMAERLSGFKAAEVELSRLHSSDLLLAKACSEGEPAAVAIFEREYLSVIDAAGRRLKMGDGGCDELRQQVRMKLLVATKGTPKICNYAGTGALRSWVYATALRTGLNELRRQGRAPMPSGDEELLVAMPDSNDDQELKYMKELYRSAFASSFRAAIKTLPDRLSNVLRHYYLDDMTLDAIGRLYRVHKTTVMRWVNKAHAELEAETKRQMIDHLNLQPSEVESVMRLIQSGIQLGLASVLAMPEDV